jgi:hypothetical protein
MRGMQCGSFTVGIEATGMQWFVELPEEWDVSACIWSEVFVPVTSARRCKLRAATIGTKVHIDRNTPRLEYPFRNVSTHAQGFAHFWWIAARQD